MINIAYNITAYKNYDNIEIGYRDKVLENEEICSDFKVMDKLFINKLRFTYEEKENVDFRENLYTKYMDYDILIGDLFFRNRKAGDYFITNSKRAFFNGEFPIRSNHVICLFSSNGVFRY